MMKDTITIRCRFKDGTTDIRCRILHEMQSGLCNQEETQKSEAHFIQKVVIKHNGNTVSTINVGPAVSDNPFFGIQVADTQKGDTIQVSWVDNQGMSDEAETTIR